ncbi:MAG: alanine racemase [Planctomycetota bacterium]
MASRLRAWAEIDLAAFRHNLARVRDRAGAAAVWPVLKANAYGHGAVRMARICEEEGVERIGVGDSGEALELRRAGVRTPVLVLGTVIDAEVPALFRHRIEVGVHSESRVRMLGAAARKARRKLGVHLKIDTGMTRLGVRPDAALRVAEAIAGEPWLELRGLMTHMASPEGFCDPFTRVQLRRFEQVLFQWSSAGKSLPAIHCANSAALFSGEQPFGDAVRVGLALYGLLPEGLAADPGLRPVLSLRTQIVFLKDIEAGTPVGYGGMWKAPQPTRIATLPIGYCDGVPYRLGREGRGAVLVRGRRCPLVGAISMDYCTADVGHVDGTRVGDTATLAGRDGQEELGLLELARAAGTIPYEITCSVGSRVRRVFFDAPLPAPASSLAGPSPS